MNLKLTMLVAVFLAAVPCVTHAQQIQLDLQMPGTLFGPGSPFSLTLAVDNSGTAVPDAQLFVALSIGSDFWFYPGWIHYPPDIDMKIIDIAAGTADIGILPEFPWPSGAGSFQGAMFFAAVLGNGVLVSNLADFSFGWTEEPQPTSTPVSPTATPVPPTSTPVPPTPTPTGPTPTVTPVPTDYVYIGPGTFTMGSPEEEFCREADETQHTVTLTTGFHLLRTEVTRQMWADLKAVQPTLPDDPSFENSSPTMNHPVQYLTWTEALLFANLSSVRDGYTRCYYVDAGFTTPLDDTNYIDGPWFCNFDADGYRLPTEAEWEYACRAGTTSTFSVEEPAYTDGNCAECIAGTHPVLEMYSVYCANDEDSTGVAGSKLPNPWELYDMHGNVWEWCWDWYGDYPTGSVTDPTGPETGTDHMRRGGNWRFGAQIMRSASRFIISPDYRFTFQGFRLARTAD